MILGSSLVILLVLFLVLYSPVKKTFAGKAIESRTAMVACIKTDLEGCQDPSGCSQIGGYWESVLQSCFSNSKNAEEARHCIINQKGKWTDGKCYVLASVGTTIKENDLMKKIKKICAELGTN